MRDTASGMDASIARERFSLLLSLVLSFDNGAYLLPFLYIARVNIWVHIGASKSGRALCAIGRRSTRK